MKKIYALLLILLTAGCSKNEANKKEDQNFDLKEPEKVSSNYTPQAGAVDMKTLDLNPEGLFCLKGSEVPYNGKTFSLWPNGKVEAEGSLKNGRPDGLTTFWYDTGEKAGEGTYKDNKRDGILIEWHKNGNKKMEQNFDAGNLLSNKFWDKEGNEVDSYEGANK
ncbi:MAG: hypothetical protein VYC72_11210 [Verrucomicrobiota bacterium]|nr:hypothetical protein [Verrucomicrobiota bacterium]